MRHLTKFQQKQEFHSESSRNCGNGGGEREGELRRGRGWEAQVACSEGKTEAVVVLLCWLAGSGLFGGVRGKGGAE